MTHEEMKELCETFEEYSLLFKCSEFAFRVDPELPEIKVEIFFDPENTKYPYSYRTSHAIHTPTQGGPYLSSITVGQTEKQAAAKAIQDIQTFFEGAKREGHTPDESWFKEMN